MFGLGRYRGMFLGEFHRYELLLQRKLLAFFLRFALLLRSYLVESHRNGIFSEFSGSNRDSEGSWGRSVQLTIRDF